MNRLTHKYLHGGYWASIFKVSACGEGEIIDRLAAYENAEEKGLLVRLPCKVGDTVKATDGNFGNGKFIITAVYPHIFTCQKVGDRYPRRTSFCKNQYYCNEVVKC